MVDVSVIVVDTQEAGTRLDKILTRPELGLSRTRAKGLIEAGCVSLNGHRATSASQTVDADDEISIEIPASSPADPEPQDIPLEIVFEDDALIVINKPAGMVTHPAPGAPDQTLVNALLHHCGASLTGIGGVSRPGIVHRLDKDTSGLMVAAKTQLAHDSLVKQFAERSVQRRYWGLATGVLAQADMTVDADIGRSRHNRKKMAVLSAGGRHAVTHIHQHTTFGLWACEIECRLETGRTHQIRVHMAHIGHPLIGDPIYGKITRHFRAAPAALRQTAQAFPRQALHAGKLGFKHPETGEELVFSQPAPQDYVVLKSSLAKAAEAAIKP